MAMSMNTDWQIGWSIQKQRSSSSTCRHALGSTFKPRNPQTLPIVTCGSSTYSPGPPSRALLPRRSSSFASAKPTTFISLRDSSQPSPKRQTLLDNRSILPDLLSLSVLLPARLPPPSSKHTRHTLSTPAVTASDSVPTDSTADAGTQHQQQLS
ncbi:hypothetical protein PCANC_27476 [Puccinia coronata f. sp. avenae]|uniref:Uncharacterized protein n=1 Tax=Puccinia coronata f. sp. avenae TaxID=200324 RepID=A0A2N5TVY3_9BASI|nr:hypothetical protein PCANC_27476 [Puccinia coronata f. sp. avenae]